MSCRCCCESGGRVNYSAGYSTSLAQYEKLSQHAVYLCVFAENINEIVLRVKSQDEIKREHIYCLLLLVL